MTSCKQLNEDPLFLFVFPVTHFCFRQRGADDQFVLWLSGGSPGLVRARQRLHQRQRGLQPQLPLHIWPKAGLHRMRGESPFFHETLAGGCHTLTTAGGHDPSLRVSIWIQFKELYRVLYSLYTSFCYWYCIIWAHGTECLISTTQIQALGILALMPTHMASSPLVHFLRLYEYPVVAISV